MLLYMLRNSAWPAGNDQHQNDQTLLLAHVQPVKQDTSLYILIGVSQFMRFYDSLLPFFTLHFTATAPAPRHNSDG